MRRQLAILWPDAHAYDSGHEVQPWPHVEELLQVSLGLFLGQVKTHREDDLYNPWQRVRDYLHGRELTAESLSQVLESQLLQYSIFGLKGGKTQNSSGFIEVDIWALRLIVDALKTPIRSRGIPSHVSTWFPAEFAHAMDEDFAEIHAPNNEAVAVPVFAVEAMVEGLDLVVVYGQRRRGRPALSWLELIAYDVAIVTARRFRKDLQRAGHSYDDAERPAIKYLRALYPMRSELRLRRDLRKADSGQPLRATSD